MAPSDVVALAKEKKVKIVDFKFMDLPGMWQHFSIPATELKEDMFEEGARFRRFEYSRAFKRLTKATCCCSPIPQPQSSTRSAEFPH